MKKAPWIISLAAAVDCHLPVKLWIHQDVSSSFQPFLSQADFHLLKVLHGLRASLPNGFDFGLSMFSDRDEESAYCYKTINPFGGDFNVKAADSVVQALTTNVSTTPRVGRDSLSAIPYIVRNHFLAGQMIGGEFTRKEDSDQLTTEDETRLLLIVTDDIGKYYGMENDWTEYGFPHVPWSTTNSKDPDFAGSEDWVGYQERMSCKPNQRYLNMLEIVEPLQLAGVTPILLTHQKDLNGRRFYAETFYKAFFAKAGFAHDDIVWARYDAVDDLVHQIIDTVVAARCHIPWNKRTTSSTTSASDSSEITMLEIEIDRRVDAAAEVLATGAIDSSRPRLRSTSGRVIPIAAAAVGVASILGIVVALSRIRRKSQPVLVVDEITIIPDDPSSLGHHLHRAT